MKLKHTPGPWKITDDGITNVISDVKDDFNIAMVFMELYDDARLISAAPEMLEVLIKQYTIICENCDGCNISTEKTCGDRQEIKTLIERIIGMKIEDVLAEDVAPERQSDEEEKECDCKDCRQ